MTPNQITEAMSELGLGGVQLARTDKPGDGLLPTGLIPAGGDMGGAQVVVSQTDGTMPAPDAQTGWLIATLYDSDGRPVESSAPGTSRFVLDEIVRWM